VLGGPRPGHRAGPRLQASDKVGDWKAAQDEIRETVRREGWNPEAGAFTQYFGSAGLDASNLMMPIVGFLPADDPRMSATIDAVADRLTDERGLVYRYRTEGSPSTASTVSPRRSTRAHPKEHDHEGSRRCSPDSPWRFDDVSWTLATSGVSVDARTSPDGTEPAR
jgi:hypothetical protein